MNSKLTFILVLCWLFAISTAQNCGVTGEETSITTPPVLETSQEGTHVWEAPTYNIVSAAAVAHPHTKYLLGLRFTSRYEYQATPQFNEFVQAERSLEIFRQVIFTCADGGSSIYIFTIPVIDENTEAPTFEHATYNHTVSLSQVGADPIDIGIFVRDADVDVKNANLFIRASNPYILLFVNPLWTEGEIPSEYYEYKVNFYFAPQSLGVGKHQIVLTADDTMHSAFALFELNIVP